MNKIIAIDKAFVEEIRNLIVTAKTRIAVTVNMQMTLLYWNIGKRVREEVVKSDRAEYGKQIIKNLSKELLAEYGRGFSEVNLSNMVKFYNQFNSLEIVQTLSKKLSWSHIVELLPLKLLKSREFYAYMAIESDWSVRELRHNIHRMTYERTIAHQKTDLPKSLTSNIERSQLQPELVLKDPYVLDFLDLPDEYYESDLEEAILREIEKFILELGTGFSFVARQKRVTIDEDHFYLDLLFYNRKLKRAVAIELKSGKFKPEYKGQMELYLRYLEKYETFEGELSPIGIILCTAKSSNQIELLNMNQSGIHVAEYLTELPPKEVLERKVQEIVLRAKENQAKLSGNTSYTIGEKED
jgi:predicted nuclease of restriction endonuclease-like (RecB) superfamily